MEKVVTECMKMITFVLYLPLFHFGPCVFSYDQCMLAIEKHLQMDGRKGLYYLFQRICLSHQSVLTLDIRIHCRVNTEAALKSSSVEIVAHLIHIFAHFEES